MFNENVLLTNQTAIKLYHTYAKDLPIIDDHSHLLASEIYIDRVFEDLGEMWLAHDPYKWRVMRLFGIEERLITGEASYYEKFIAFAQLLPKLIGDPLNLLCALELKRYFEIEEPLNKESAEQIYQETKKWIQTQQITPRWCMARAKVKSVNVVEESVSRLDYYYKLQSEVTYPDQVFPIFKVDKMFYCEKPGFGAYVKQLSQVVHIEIVHFRDLLQALECRVVAFKRVGAMIAQMTLEQFVWVEEDEDETERIFNKAIKNRRVNAYEANQYKTAFLLGIAKIYYKYHLVMQLHIGLCRGMAKTKGMEAIEETKSSYMNDEGNIKSIGKLLNVLAYHHLLPKVVLYPTNPMYSEAFATMVAAFCEEGLHARVRVGVPWGFNNDAYAIGRQLEQTSHLYPLSLSLGMATDSYTFLDYSHQEIYRRVLCNYIGEQVELGLYVGSELDLQQLVEQVCYQNAKEYFRMP